MKLTQKEQSRSFVQKIIAGAEDLLTTLLRPNFQSTNELHKPVRIILFIMVAVAVAVLIHLLSSPERWIRI